MLGLEDFQKGKKKGERPCKRGRGLGMLWALDRRRNSCLLKSGRRIKSGGTGELGRGKRGEGTIKSRLRGVDRVEHEPEKAE